MAPRSSEAPPEDPGELPQEGCPRGRLRPSPTSSCLLLFSSHCRQARSGRDFRALRQAGGRARLSAQQPERGLGSWRISAASSCCLPFCSPRCQAGCRHCSRDLSQAGDCARSPAQWRELCHSRSGRTRWRPKQPNRSYRVLINAPRRSSESGHWLAFWRHIRPDGRQRHGDLSVQLVCLLSRF